jgi:PAS domain S-box-containing protein
MKRDLSMTANESPQTLALRASEARMAAILEVALDAIITIDHDGRILDFNPAAEKIFGYARHEALGQEMAELTVPLALRERHRQGLARAVATGRNTIVGHRIDITAMRKGGEEFPAELAITRISSDGPPIFTGHVRDISERVRNEAEIRRLNLQESEARLKTILEHAPEAIMSMDAETGKFVEVNENAVRLFGRSREELLSIGPESLSPPTQPDGQSSAAKARGKVGEALAGGAPVFDWMHLNAAGEEILCEVRLARFPAAGRNLAIGTITDITERKRAEKELLAALEKEKELVRLKSGFVSMVSHEFRTPLAVIVSCAEILRDYQAELRPEKKRRHLDAICEASLNLSKLIDEVLLLGKVEAGKLAFTPAELDLPDLCRQLADNVTAAAQRKRPIHFAALPLSSSAVGDAGLLRHIFVNLLSNTVKYSAPDSPVEFSFRRERRNAVFVIRDHGIGIPPGDLPQVFEAFHRGDNVGQLPGTGLGLAIVKRCVERHRGQIVIESKTGEGTTVTVQVPMFGKQKTRTATKSRKGKPAIPARKVSNNT